MRRRIAIIGVTASIIAGVLVGITPDDKPMRDRPAGSDDGHELAVLVLADDVEGIAALESVLHEVFCAGKRFCVDLACTREAECPDTARRSLTQRWIDSDGKLVLGAQWTLDARTARRVARLDDVSSLRVYRNRRQFQRDVARMELVDDTTDRPSPR